MYLNATIGIDPSQLTQLTRVKPSKIFGKLFYYLTAGLSGERRELETFTAVSVLQQLNMAMRSLKITNIVRLAIDGTDLYLDEQGRPDDLDEAMKHVEVRGRVTNDTEIAFFERILLVLEHDLDNLRLLIQIDIERVHPEDEFPILVRIDGLLRDFDAQQGEDPAALRQRMAPSFGDQDRYEQLLSTRESEFEAFVDELVNAIRKQVRVDEVSIDIEQRMIRPQTRVDSRAAMRRRLDDAHDDLFYGYHGFEDAFLYAWVWSELSHEHAVHVSDVALVDESGRAVLDVGPEGFDAGDGATLDPDQPFEAPDGADVTFHSGSDYADTWTPEVDATSGASDTDSGGWLDGVFDSSGFDSGGASSCDSSCGGCSSCMSD